MEPLIKFWLFLCHWIEFDTFESEEDLDGTVETLTRAGLPFPNRTRPGKAGVEQRRVKFGDGRIVELQIVGNRGQLTRIQQKLPVFYLRNRGL